jgi:Aspartyl/Asparaginyl beta-hydroxylase
MISYPEATPLTLDFDVARLQGDLDVLRQERWGAQRPYGQDGFMPAVEIDWRILSLRSVGGDPARTDPGGAGLTGFADTPWLSKAPYLGAVIAAVPAPIRSVRLMALGVGTQVHEHRDGKYGFACGTLRLHVPVRTNPDAVVVIDGRSRHWEAGRLWFGDFGRPHYVANTGDETRVHMVIDTLITRELVELFPGDFRGRLPHSEVLFARPPIPLTAGELDRFRRRFPVPAEFPQWSEEEVADGPDHGGAIEIHDGRPVLCVDGRPSFGLVHLGLGEFRLVGWTEERTIVVDVDGTVRFRVREGRRLRESTRTVLPD